MQIGLREAICGDFGNADGTVGGCYIACVFACLSEQLRHLTQCQVAGMCDSATPRMTSPKELVSVQCRSHSLLQPSGKRKREVWALDPFTHVSACNNGTDAHPEFFRTVKGGGGPSDPESIIYVWF
jgi:hypothetical protein